MRRTVSIALFAWFAVALVALAVGPDGIAPAGADEGAPAAEFIGAKGCKKCHFKQHKTWKVTPLALGFEHLKPDQCGEAKKKVGLDPKKDYTTDPKCLKCHTTGYGQPSGYPEVKEGVAWTDAEKARAALTQGVQCEACHGAGSLFAPFKKKNKKYKREEIRKLGAITPPTAESCAPCHVKECPTMPADYKFDFEASKASEKLHAHSKLKYEH